MHTVKIFDLLLGFTKALGFVRPITASHNLRVAYFAHLLASDCNFSKSERVNLLVASILHDVGAIPLKIETQNFIFDRDKQNYCRAGWVFCKSAKLNDWRIQLASATPSKLNEKARWYSPLASPSNQRLRGVWAMHTLPGKNGTTSARQ